jgi:hypothetical protein
VAPQVEVEIRIEPSTHRHAEWGGWHWQAEGVDRAQAERRLRVRLGRLTPFDGFDTDWGDPGYKIGDLDQTIAEERENIYGGVGADSSSSRLTS